MAVERINLFLSLQDSRISGRNTKSFKRSLSQRVEEGDKLTNRLQNACTLFYKFYIWI